jgi:hypothetical protein
MGHPVPSLDDLWECLYVQKLCHTRNTSSQDGQYLNGFLNGLFCMKRSHKSHTRIFWSSYELYLYREDHKVVRLFANKKNVFNNRWYLNLRCPGETSDTYLTIDQKFIGVVSTETEIWFFEKSVRNFKFQISKSKKIWIWKKKSNFFWHFFLKKSYISLSTDYTYKFLVNGQIGVWSFTWSA